MQLVMSDQGSEYSTLWIVKIYEVDNKLTLKVEMSSWGMLDTNKTNLAFKSLKQYFTNMEKVQYYI